MTKLRGMKHKDKTHKDKGHKPVTYYYIVEPNKTMYAA